MNYKFLYIDDVLFQNAEGTIEGLISEDFKIEFTNPISNWNEFLRFLTDKIPQLDGLIIDLRLYEEKNVAGEISNYRGNTVAQEIRTLVKEGSIKDLPIILLSAEKNIELSFDFTSTDLFDIVVSKESLRDQMFSVLNIRLKSLADGYRILNSLSSSTIVSDLILEKILGLEKIDSKEVDMRFVSEIKRLSSLSPHNLSNFIMGNFITKPGILISEDLLAARFGVDRVRSKEWPRFLKIIGSCEYKGIYSSGWPSWWMFKVLKWWHENFESKNIQLLSADERVSLINQKFNLELIPAEVIDKATSKKFWTICKGLEKPLDPIDGLVISGQDSLFPWQEKQYVSFYEALNRANVNKWKGISQSETNKFEKVKQIFTRVRVRN